MIQESASCKIIQHNSQILFYQTQVAEITGWIVAGWLLVEEEVPKLWAHWTEVLKLVGAPIISR